MSKLTTLTILIMLIAGSAMGQSKKHHKIGYKSLDYEDTRIMPDTQLVKIKCIAYSIFGRDGKLIYINCDTVVKKQVMLYEGKYDKYCKCYVRTLFDFPINILHMDGTSSYYDSETYWYKCKEIHPIEIITKPF